MTKSFRWWMGAFGSGVVSVVLVGGAMAWASIPDSAGVIHGCYVRSTGAVRVIDTEKGQKCTTKESGLNWNQTGKQGTPGTNGVSGYVEESGNLTDTNAVKTLTVPCPAGKSVLGGGGIAGSGDQLAVLESSAPGTSTEWTATARETNGIAGYNWTLSVFALCASTS